MGFLLRWLSHGIGLTLALVLGVIAMQAPAFTREYAAGLRQAASELHRDIDERESAARRYYNLTALSGDALVAALATHEPSNAASLSRSLARARRIDAASGAIDASSALLRPLVAFGTAWRDPEGSNAAIWKRALASYALQLDFSAAAAIYGFAGLMLGSLLAELMRAALHRAQRRAMAQAPR
jgi:Protein of unknown function (DUF2937)